MNATPLPPAPTYPPHVQFVIDRAWHSLRLAAGTGKAEDGRQAALDQRAAMVAIAGWQAELN